MLQQDNTNNTKLMLSLTNCSSQSQVKPSLAEPFRNFRKQLLQDEQPNQQQLDKSKYQSQYQIKLYQPSQQSYSRQNTSLSMPNSNKIIRYSHPALCVDSQTQSSQSSSQGVRPYTFTQYKTGQIMTIMNQNFDQYETKMKELFQQRFGHIGHYFLSSRSSEKQLTSNQNSQKFRKQSQLNRINQYLKEPHHYYLPISQENSFQLFIVRKSKGNIIKTYSFQIYQALTMKQLLQVHPIDRGYQIIFKNLKNHQNVLSIISSNFFRSKYRISPVNQHHYAKNSFANEEDTLIKFSLDPLYMNNYQKITIKIPKIATKLKKYKKNKYVHKPQHTDQIHDTFYSKEPRWSPEIKKYILDFSHKKICISSKNFIIVDKSAKNKSIISLCKLRTNLYRAQIAYPFSLLQGVGLIVSNLDQRI